MYCNPQPFEIFCGTGGVGKTTLATSRAIHLARKGKRVLLITIDPSHRLKEVLGLNPDNAGKVEHVYKFGLDALLMVPRTSLLRLLKNNVSSELSQKMINNRIISILTRPHGGMNEILSIVEVQYHLNSKEYDTIVLDTPPGGHFLDFLDSSKKIQNFFDQSFIDIFKYLGKKINTSQQHFPSKMLNFVVSGGIKKLLHYLEKITGKSFINEFIDAIEIIYRSKDSFLKILNFQEHLSKKNTSNWFLVTSLEQHKFSEALELHKKTRNFMPQSGHLLLNKSIKKHMQGWQQQDDLFINNLQNCLIQKEDNILNSASKTFQNILTFDDILSGIPYNQVMELAKQWEV